MTTAGVLLAAGAGRRMGGPKALRRTVDGVSWVALRAADLARGGCGEVVVVLGAAAQEAAATLPAQLPGPDGEPVPVVVVTAADWAEGMGASLRAGLRHLSAASRADDEPAVALVALVDTPDVGPAVVARLVDVVAAEGVSARQLLARAAYRGRPGHPVVIGRDHWDAVTAVAQGDAGARGYLAVHAVRPIECGDVGDDRDLDVPDDLG